MKLTCVVAGEIIERRRWVRSSLDADATLTSYESYTSFPGPPGPLWTPGARCPVPGEGPAMPPRTGSVAAALVAALVVTALAAPPAHAATVTIAVAPTGDDANPGTPEQPVVTPAKAQK